MAGAQAAWGIDVGVSSLKALKLRRDGDRVTVEAFEVMEHDKFLTEPDVDRDMLIRSTLQKFMSKYNVRRDVVYIGVPGNTTFARFVKLPPVETKKIPEIVRFEAIQQIPFPLDQVNWDYHTFQAPDSPDVEVGIFAMKELVAQIMSNFRAVDMNVQGVQMSPLAVYNAAFFDGMTNDKGTIIIDMGAEHTDLVIMDQGRVWLRSINIGGNHFTDALAKSFKQQFGKAESLKKTAATSKYQKQIYQAMRPIFADLVAEIQRSLGAYNSTHRDSRLERVVCMGNPFKLPNLQKYLQQELKLEVVRLETYRQANVEKAAAFSENILSMSAAYGLAIQALGLAQIKTSLLPMEIARAMMWKKKQPWFIGAAALLALGAVGMGAQYWAGSSNYSDQVDEQGANALKADEFNKLLNGPDGWNKINNNFKDSQDALDKQFQLVTSRKVWPMLWRDIVSALPQAQPQKGATVVITDMNVEYFGHLTAASLAATGAGGTGAVAATPTALPIDPNVPAPATPQKAEGQIGDSDHGFVIRLAGYTPRGAQRPDQYAREFQELLAARADEKNTDKPYYFESSKYFNPGGHQITGSTTPVGGGAFGGGGAVATAAQPGDRPWGNVKGPYWELFVTEISGKKATAPAVGPGMPGLPGGPIGSNDAPPVGDIESLDLMTKPPRPMAGYYTFTLAFKVHVKNEIKY